MTSPIHPMILSGGSGTRLWPASRAAMPKQLLALTSHDTLLQETLKRFVGSTFARPTIICASAHAKEIERQTSKVGGANIITEPTARSTAPAAIVAAARASSYDPSALVLLVSADHDIRDPSAFRACVQSAIPAAESGGIVTFGVVPDGPNTGYGYIRAPGTGSGPRAVEAFTEKPNRETAQAWVADGNHFWNAGIFLFRADVLLEEANRLAPDVTRFALQAVEKGISEGEHFALDAQSFARCPGISIDYAIMERTSKAVVVPASFPWSDVGSWDAIWELGSDGDPAAVVATGDVESEGCAGTLLRADPGGPRITAMGLRDMVVVATATDVLVIPRQMAERVRELAGKREGG
jgi:mannose-1-phosphate guanylyltransferase/mannose-6-phosphate isomerase